MATYKNPWWDGGKNGPRKYQTDARPVVAGKCRIYHRIKSSNRSANCYDVVVNGVCQSQRFTMQGARAAVRAINDGSRQLLT